MADLSLGPLGEHFGENVARFSDLLHSNQTLYKRLYDRYADQEDGFTGLYQIPIRAGYILAVMEDDESVEWGGIGVNDWIESTEQIMLVITRRALESPENVPITDDKWLKGVIRSVMGGAKDWSPRS